MKLALVHQHAGPDPDDNLRRGLAAYEQAADRGADLVCFAELAFVDHEVLAKNGQIDHIAHRRQPLEPALIFL